MACDKLITRIDILLVWGNELCIKMMFIFFFFKASVPNIIRRQTFLKSTKHDPCFDIFLLRLAFLFKWFTSYLGKFFSFFFSI